MKSKNKYLYPVDVRKARISCKDSPAHKGRLKHSVDFIVGEGTEIRATCRGVVVDVKQDSDVGGKTQDYDKYGNFIEIKHNNNEFSIYEHIRKNGSLVSVGDKVKAGQVIGYSGETGWIAHLGAHLHFDVHRYFGKGKEDYETLEIVWKNVQFNS